jgi:dTDP-L-rhamnose 4-epimerase
MMDMKGMTCLVTGGAGMIGSHIVDILLKEYQCKVKVVDSLKVASHPDQTKPVWVPDEVEFIQGSAADRKLMESAMQGVDVVFHQAASGFEFANPGSYTHCFTDATMSTCTIFDVIKDLKLPCRKVVIASSMAVYGEASYSRKDGSEYIPDAYRPTARLEKGLYEIVDDKGEECGPFAIKESRALMPPFAYHLAKFNQEKIALAAGTDMKLSVTALRYSIAHGPRQSVHNPYTGVMSIFCTQILNGKSPLVFEDGKQTRDFVFAEDVARANIFVAQHPKTGGEVYNVGTGRKGDEMGKVASILCDLLRKPGSDVKPEYPGLFRIIDTRHFRLDPTKLMSLGWKPRYTLEEGLKKHTDWVTDVAEKAGGVEDKFASVLAKMTETGVVKRRKVGE